MGVKYINSFGSFVTKREILVLLIKSLPQHIKIRLRDDVVSIRCASIEPANRGHRNGLRRSETDKITIGRSAKVVKADTRTQLQSGCAFLGPTLVEDRLFCSGLGIAASQRYVADRQTRGFAGSRPALLKVSDRTNLGPNLPREHVIIRKTFFRHDRHQQLAQRADHRKGAAFFVFGFARLEADLASIEVNMSASKLNDLASTPAGDVSESCNRDQMLRQMSAKCVNLMHFEKSFADIAFFDDWKYRDVQHLWRRRFFPQIESTSHRLEFAIDRRNLGALLGAHVSVVLQHRRRDLSGFHAPEDRQDVNAETRVDVITRCVLVVDVVHNHISGEFLNEHGIGFRGDRFAGRDIANPSLTELNGVLDRVRMNGLKMPISIGIPVIDQKATAPASADALGFGSHADRKFTTVNKQTGVFMTMTMYRQGDVLLRRVSKIPTDVVPAEKQHRIVLAYGEVTGHAHAIHDLESVDVFVKPDGTMYLSVANPVDLVHEEHRTVAIPAGIYERVLQREYSPEQVRNVAD